MHFPFLMLIILIFACCSTVPEKGNSSETTIEENPFFRNTNTNVDSILEFNSIILSIFEDSKGVMWFGSWCDGMAKYDPKDIFPSGAKKFTYYNVNNGIPGKEIIEFNNRKVPRGNAVRDIYEDANQNIIIATLAGVAKYDGTKFTELLPIGEKQEISKSLAYVAGNWQREYESLWFGNISTNGVYKLESDTLRQFTFPEPAEESNGFKSQYAMYSHTKDREGNIWFGTEGGGIFRYGIDGINLINPAQEKGIVRCIFQDVSGLVWISNVLEGVFTYDHKAFLKGEEYFTCFTKAMGFNTLSEVRSRNLKDDKMFDTVQTIAQDDNGVLWFGTFGNGLWSYDSSQLPDLAFTHYSKDNGLPSNTVKSILKDKSGKLWFGIGENYTHLYHFDGKEFLRIDK